MNKPLYQNICKSSVPKLLPGRFSLIEQFLDMHTISSIHQNFFISSMWQKQADYRHNKHWFI